MPGVPILELEKEDAMPEFSALSVQEAILQTTPKRRKPYLDEYIGYINQLSPGRAGVLSRYGDEKHSTIRNRLTSVAKVVGIALIIRRHGDALFFWSEEPEAAAPRRRRRGSRAGGIMPP
jgi:hypothetical protein